MLSSNLNNEQVRLLHSFLRTVSQDQKQSTSFLGKQDGSAPDSAGHARNQSVDDSILDLSNIESTNHIPHQWNQSHRRGIASVPNTPAKGGSINLSYLRHHRPFDMNVTLPPTSPTNLIPSPTESYNNPTSPVNYDRRASHISTDAASSLGASFASNITVSTQPPSPSVTIASQSSPVPIPAMRPPFPLLPIATSTPSPPSQPLTATAAAAPRSPHAPLSPSASKLRAPLRPNHPPHAPTPTLPSHTIPPRQALVTSHTGARFSAQPNGTSAFSVHERTRDKALSPKTSVENIHQSLPKPAPAPTNMIAASAKTTGISSALTTTALLPPSPAAADHLSPAAAQLSPAAAQLSPAAAQLSPAAALASLTRAVDRLLAAVTAHETVVRRDASSLDGVGSFDGVGSHATSWGSMRASTDAPVNSRPGNSVVGNPRPHIPDLPPFPDLPSEIRVSVLPDEPGVPVYLLDVAALYPTMERTH